MSRDPSGASAHVVLESLADRAYLAIRERILRGDLPIGSPLSRRQLATNLKMSVLPVGEALQHLENEGLVETRYRAGTRVRIPSADDIREQYIIREALESQAARLVAQRATLKQLHDLRRMAEQVDLLFARGAESQEDPEFLFMIHSHHFQLHMRVAEHTGCNALRDEIERKLTFNWLYGVVGPRRNLPSHFHRDLIESMCGRDPEEADAVTRRHVRYGLEELLATLQPRGNHKWRLVRPEILTPDNVSARLG